MLRIGIDLGGTKIELVALDTGGRELLRRRAPTPAGDYAATVEAIGALVDAAERDLGARGTVGIGIPGSPSPRDGRIRNANSTCLNGRPLRQDLQARLARAVRLENDANCFAVSEAVDGAAAGARVVFGVILGTGVGGGIAIEGRSLAGRNRVAGEWGHNPLPWPHAAELPGPRCWCGRHGCIEAWLSGPALAADHAREAAAADLSMRPQAVSPPASSVAAHASAPDAARMTAIACAADAGRIAAPLCVLDASRIAALAAAGDAACAATIERHAERLGRALAHVVNLLDPDAIVLGGGLSNVQALCERLPERIAPHVFSDVFATPVLRAAHGDSSGVRGAAWLWGRDAG